MYLSDCLADIISEYKQYFPHHFHDEQYKWEAIKHFQDHWDVHAPNFKEMLEESLSKTYNLLSSGYFYAKAMILQFAEIDPEAVRAAFMNLYDESKNLEERVESFWAFAENWKANRNPDGWKNHYQNTNAISVYLWLRYPDKYYIYKYSECLGLAQAMNSTFIPKRTSSPANLVKALPTKVEALDTYTKEDFLNQVYMTGKQCLCIYRLQRCKQCVCTHKHEKPSISFPGD